MPGVGFVLATRWLSMRHRCSCGLLFCLTAEPDARVVDALAAKAREGLAGARRGAGRRPRRRRRSSSRATASSTLAQPDPVTPDTVFPLASCTKAFTTTLLAMLVDDGQAGLGRPGPQAPAGVPPVRPERQRPADAPRPAVATARPGRATTCSGTTRPWSIDEIIGSARNAAARVPVSRRLPLFQHPVHGRRAGRWSARPARTWEKLVRTRICEPLGMTGVTFTTKDIPKDADRAAATGWARWARSSRWRI